jgi:hypothetical protein
MLLPMDDLACRSLNPGDVEQAALVISLAFMDDPLSAFMLPLRRSRLHTLIKFFRPYGELNIKNQRGYRVGEPLKAVAFWLEPGKSDISISIKALGSFLPLIFTLYPLGYIRARQVLKTTDELHQQYASEPHFYLDNIGVLPAERTGTFFPADPPFQRADDEKVLVYTDTVTSRNVPFYEHFGFECIESRSIQKTG